MLVVSKYRTKYPKIISYCSLTLSWIVELSGIMHYTFVFFVCFFSWNGVRIIQRRRQRQWRRRRRRQATVRILRASPTIWGEWSRKSRKGDTWRHFFSSMQFTMGPIKFHALKQHCFQLPYHSVLERIWIKGSYLSLWLPQGERRPPKDSKSWWIEILHGGSH